MGNDISSGHTYADTEDGRRVDVDNLNRHVNDATIKETFISAKTLKSPPALSDQLIISDGALKKTTLELIKGIFLPDGFLSADTAGRSKMADGFLTLAKIASGIFTADTDGRAKFANGFVNLALLADDAKIGGTVIRGLKVAYASSSTITLEVTEAVLPNGSGGYARHFAPSTQTINIATTGANGLDTGSETSGTWYYVWAISDGTNFRGLLSTSASAPTMPGAYTFKVLVGAVRNDGSSNFVNFVQFGRRVFIAAQNVFTNQAGVTSRTSQSLSSYIPPTAVNVSGIAGVSVNDFKWIELSGDSSGIGSAILYPSANNLLEGGFYAAGPFSVPVLSSQAIYWKATDTSADYRLSITGWEYNL